jgi:Tol biopolymer transport system component
MRSPRGSAKLLSALVALSWFAACSDNPGDPSSLIAPLPDGVIVSNPVPPVALGAETRAAFALAPSAGTDVVYVSLAPGTVPAGNQAVVRRVGDAASLTTAVTDGGFDPVPVPAQTGDSIDVVVTDAGGAVVLQQRVLVAAARPPVIVRTEPPPGKRDVPLNAAMVIVFSEPVNGNTVNSASVQLFRGSTPVAGTVSLLSGTATSAVFAPAAPLDANADYRLTVTRAVRDLQGDPLTAADTVGFTTGTLVAGPVASVSLGLNSDTATVVALGSRFQLTATARDAQGFEVVGLPVTWGSSDPTVLSVSATGLVTALAEGLAAITASVDGQSGQALFAVSTIPAGTVTVTPESARVALGGTVPLRAAVWDPNGQGLYQRLVTWSSSDPTVATVAPGQSSQSNPVMVTGVAAGIARISATVDGKSDTAIVTVSSVASVVVTPESATVEIFGSIQLTATLRDGQGAPLSGGLIAWTSDSPAAATVNASGLVTAVGGGVARVIAASGGASDTATITVQGIAGRIAFVSSRDGNAEIYAMNADGSGLVRLTNDPATDQSPAWSPDGSRIAFVSDRDGPLNVYTMNADGTGIVRLTADTASDLHPAWSPDGRRIAFESTRDGASPQIYVMNADGTDVVRLAYDTATVTDTTGSVLHTYADQSPTWSPDGSSLAFIGYHGSYEIHTIHADGTGMSRLTAGLDAVYRFGRSPYGPPDGSRLAWSPDGSRFVVAYVGMNSAGLTNGGIALVNADGTGAHWIYNSVFVNAFRTCSWVIASSPAWSPDAARIVFALWVADGCATGERGRPPYASIETRIQVMNVDGTGVHALTTSINRNNDEPSWKP